MQRDQLVMVLVVLIPTLLAEVVVVATRPGPLVVLGPAVGFASFLLWQKVFRKT